MNPQYVTPQRVPSQDPVVSVHSEELTRPFAFALGFGDGGATIWHGCLLGCITRLDTYPIDAYEFITHQQGEIPSIAYVVPTIFGGSSEGSMRPIQLDWYGPVYLQWTANEDGEILTCDIVQELPDAEPIGPLEGSLGIRSTPEGTYYVEIGEVTKGQPIKQYISSDVPWMVTIVKNGPPPAPGGSGSEAGSSKDTCIVPSDKHPEGFAACFIPEMPREGVFLDTLAADLTKRVTRVRMDPWFVKICEAGTFQCVGHSTSHPVKVGVSIDAKGVVTITKPLFSRSCRVDLIIYAIRRGFLRAKNNSPYNMRRMPQRNREQFEANERFINSAYPSFE